MASERDKSVVSEFLQFNRLEDAHEYLLALLNLMARNADIAESEKSPTSFSHNIIRKLFGGQLQRFTPWNDKLDYHVDFPLLFDMPPHMVDSSGPPVRYRLYATINHRSGHSQCGHYVAFTRRRYNLWYCHNYDTVTEDTAVDQTLEHKRMLT
ncbi:ubiquitin specific peptidase 42 C19 family [Echinococcus multilocularis]|uniref:Ubiquitin carboxyl-terminal hydrolase 36 n=1 Tax=Echinococcus multilocularis TaxID=6211 RepID=A0A068Y0P8_ECHMU|nr:ubiquitin specific peptidase 42 C19 family [Echinococcus multilocularis]